MPRRTLIVDDNKSFLSTAATILHGPEFAVVGTATNGTEALRQVQSLAPDLILLDIDLGAESGFALAPRLTERLDGAPPEVVMVSAHPQDDFADLIAESPAVGFLSKADLSRAALGRLLSPA